MPLKLARTIDGDPAIRIRHLVLAMLPSSVPELGSYRICTGFPARDPATLGRSDFTSTGEYVEDEAAFAAHAQDLIDHYDAVEKLARKSLDNPVPTPWGPSQSRVRYAEGVECVTTAGHGGVLLSPEMNQIVDPEWRSGDGAYEEDQMWAVVAFTFPDLFTKREMKFARKTLRNDFPDIYERLTGELIPIEECESRRRQAFYARHANDLIVISAIRSKLDRSKTICAAAAGGRGPDGRTLPPTKMYLVDSAEYDSNYRPYGFIIDPTRHPETDSDGNILADKNSAT